jgi:hypothetical protein
MNEAKLFLFSPNTYEENMYTSGISATATHTTT